MASVTGSLANALIEKKSSERMVIIDFIRVDWLGEVKNKLPTNHSGNVHNDVTMLGPRLKKMDNIKNAGTLNFASLRSITFRNYRTSKGAGLGPVNPFVFNRF